ncbi:islet amyloid polypeptide [Gouania willdenowi]|uniref:Calcitonin peptide-like domain-containing protein n=1 Tax=Gouania willdenowi TaxID=441366 RepID=A0A8C5G0V4_GOUWI|nr:islet amyloid polypeptide [Gouania willdenowi]
MYHLRVPALLLVLLVLLHCITAAPNHRYFSPLSSSELQENTLPDSDDDWLLSGLISNPFLGLMSTRPRRGLTASNSHNIQKRKCNTATCVTQRLADFLVRSSNTVGTVYIPTNVGSSTYGKRELLQPPSYLPL